MAINQNYPDAIGEYGYIYLISALALRRKNLVICVYRSIYYEQIVLALKGTARHTNHPLQTGHRNNKLRYYTAR